MSARHVCAEPLPNRLMHDWKIMQALALAETEELSGKVKSFFGMRNRPVHEDALGDTIQVTT